MLVNRNTNKNARIAAEVAVSSSSRTREKETTTLTTKDGGSSMASQIQQQRRFFPKKQQQEDGKERHHDPCLIFYHIPKVGGCSTMVHIREIAKALNWRVIPLYEYSENNTNTLEYLVADAYGKARQNVVWVGHLTPGFEELTSTQQCYRITVLREPVDRVMSAFYFHAHRTPEWKPCLLTIPKVWPTSSTQQQHQQQQQSDNNNNNNNALVRFRQAGHAIRVCRFWHEYHNDMVRMFGAGPMEQTWSHYQTLQYAIGLDPNPNNTNSRVWLDNAKDFLSSLDAVCLLSELKHCLQWLAHTLLNNATTKAGFLDTLVRENVNPQRRDDQVDTVLRQRIAEANSLDSELYQWVVQNFNSQGQQQQ